MKDIHRIIETLLFASPEPLTEKSAMDCIDSDTFSFVEIVNQLNKEYQSQNKGIYIDKIAGGYQILTRPEVHYCISRLYQGKKKWMLSSQSLEALSIIAYKQPVSKIEMEYIRGVSCDSVIKSLLEKELITIKGRESGIGRALLYGTTQVFLEALGIHSLSDLPSMKEIEVIINEKPSPVELVDADEQIPCKNGYSFQEKM